MTSPEVPDGTDPPAGRGIRGSGEALRRFVELLAFCGFAITQPVLDSFGTAPEHFVFRGVTPTEIIVFAVVVALVPPACLAVASLAIGGLSERTGRIVHVAALSALGGLAAIQFGWRTLDLTSVPLLLFGLVIGGVVAALYLRVKVFRVWARYTAVLPAVAVFLFLFSSPVSDLVWSRTVDAATLDLAETPPIVMLVLDELPTATLVGADGEIDADLFPNFARMGEIGTWYRNNSTNSNNTILAVPALLTGRVPAQLQGTLANHPDNLFTLLGGSYDIRADERPMQLCPENLCSGVSTGGGGLSRLLGDARRLWRAQVSIDEPGGTVFDLIEETVAVEQDDDPESSSTAEGFAAAFGAAEQLMTTSPSRQAAFLDAIGPSARPTLNYLHLQLPHGPFRFYPNGAEYERPDPALDTVTRYAQRVDSPVPAEVHRQRHVLQTQFADALLGQLLDRLEEQDLLDESIVVVASDHGISFNPGVTPRLNTEETLPADSVDDVFWSALFMKSPGQEVGGVSDAPTQLIDVLPTLIDWLDADPGWELDGVSVDRLGAREERTLCRPGAEGGSLTVDCVEYVEGDTLTELLDSAVGLFLPAENPDLRVYRAGPFGSLVGLRADEMDLGDAGSQEIAVKGLDAFTDVRTDATLPGFVTGSLASGDEGVVLALSLNGTIAAVAESFNAGGEQGLVNAMLPNSLFVAGGNEIEVYVVDGSVAAPTLHRITVTEG